MLTVDPTVRRERDVHVDDTNIGAVYIQCVIQHTSVDQYASVYVRCTLRRPWMLHARAACVCTDTKHDAEARQTFIPLFISVQLRIDPDGCRFPPFKPLRRFRYALKANEICGISHTIISRENLRSLMLSQYELE